MIKFIHSLKVKVLNLYVENETEMICHLALILKSKFPFV